MNRISGGRIVIRTRWTTSFSGFFTEEQSAEANRRLPPIGVTIMLGRIRIGSIETKIERRGLVFYKDEVRYVESARTSPSRSSKAVFRLRSTHHRLTRSVQKIVSSRSPDLVSSGRMLMNRRRLIIPVALIAFALSSPSAFGRGRSHGGGGHGGGHGGGGHGGGHPHPVSAPRPHAPSHPKNHASAAAAPHHPVAHNAPKHAATIPQAPKSAAVKTADRGSSGASKPSTEKSTSALASTNKTVTKPATSGVNTLKTATGSAGLATTGIGVGGTHSRGYQYNRNANPNTIAPLLMVGAMTNPNFSGRNWGYHHHYYGGYHRGYRRRWYNNNGMNNNIAYRRLMRLKHDLDMIRPGMTLQNRHTQYLSRDLMGVVRPGNQRPPTPVVHNLASHPCSE